MKLKTDFPAMRLIRQIRKYSVYRKLKTIRKILISMEKKVFGRHVMQIYVPTRTTGFLSGAFDGE